MNIQGEILYLLSYEGDEFRIKYCNTIGSCIVEIKNSTDSEWECVDGDGICAQIYMMALLEERKKNENYDGDFDITQ